LSAHQAGLLEHLLPKLTLVLEKGRDPRSYFDRDVSNVWLEIGFGGGEHLFWQAEANPGTGIVGAEPYVAGMAKLLSKIADKNFANIRLYQEDAHDILAALPDACLSRVFILFPDPWPKKRHHKRRFIQMESLSEFARVMRPGAELRFATDDPGYLVWALERLTVHPCFEWLAQCAADWRARPPDWPQTRYEAKAARQGRACTYLRFRRT
jgi:tRNA (guanine-N7-)-methyltransferase